MLIASRFTPHMNRGLIAVFLLAVVCVVSAAAQTPQDSGNGRKTAQAVRVPAGAIDVDGRVGDVHHGQQEHRDETAVQVGRETGRDAHRMPTSVLDGT